MIYSEPNVSDHGLATHIHVALNDKPSWKLLHDFLLLLSPNKTKLQINGFTKYTGDRIR